MWACSNGHIDIARMLVGEHNVNIEIQNTVSAIVRLLLCGDVQTCIFSVRICYNSFYDLFHYCNIAFVFYC